MEHDHEADGDGPIASRRGADGDGLGARRRRSDAEQNFSRIIEAKVALLEDHPAPSIVQIATATGFARATVYRHFSSRNQLLDTPRRHALDAAAISAAQATATAPETTDDAGEVGVAELLNRVPAHLVGDQIVAEARRLPGVSSVALYLVDIDGSRLCRFAGSPEFPAELDAPLAVGPEIPRDGSPRRRRTASRQRRRAALPPRTRDRAAARRRCRANHTGQPRPRSRHSGLPGRELHRCDRPKPAAQADQRRR